MTTPGSPAKSLFSTDFFANTSRARLQALYSDFSLQKQSNPTAFHANVEWWRKTLEALADSGLQQDTAESPGSRLVLQANRKLLDNLKIEKIGKPLAMGAVVVSHSGLPCRTLTSNKTLS